MIAFAGWLTLMLWLISAYASCCCGTHTHERPAPWFLGERLSLVWIGMFPVGWIGLLLGIVAAVTG